jgi:hypothetical protein
MNAYRCITVTGIAVGCLLMLALPARAADGQPASMRNAAPSERVGNKGLAMPIGQAQTSWLVMGSEFVGRTSGFVPSRNGFGAELACTIGSTERRARGRLALPDGVVLNAIDIWRYDMSASQDLLLTLSQHCLPSGSAGAAQAEDLLVLLPPPAAPGYAATSTALVFPIAIDGLQCSYYVEADFGANCAAGQDLRLLGVRVHWGQP